MLCYDRIGFSVEIGILIETSASNNIIFAFIGIFLKKRFKCQPCVCKRCHDLLMISMNLANV